MNLPDALYTHLFNLLPQFGNNRLLKLSNYFPSYKEGFFATSQELEYAGIEPEIINHWDKFKTTINPEHEWEKLQTEKINLLTPHSNSYPALLREIEKYPALLYFKGIMPDWDELCIAAVGTRKITNYGRTVTPLIIDPLIDAGVTMVSGMAYGVDATVHKMAIEKQKRTVAILGCGLDNSSIYPKEHAWLADQIIENGGALISEYPIGTAALKYHFIARNRIISGMSAATIIVECNLKSGSLITARYALEQNRAVYAVPGQIYAEQSQGPNNLIKMGARLVTCAQDILEDLNIENSHTPTKTKIPTGDNPTESALLRILSFDPINLNQLIKESGLPAGDVISALTFLEMKGYVRNLGGQQYVICG